MNIVNKFIEKIKNLDNQIKKLMNKGLLFSFILCIFSTLLLFTYELFFEIPNLYYIGLSLFKSSLMFGCVFIMCAVGFDTIKNEIA